MTQLITVKLDQPVKRGDTEIAEVKVRQPNSGELRGLSLLDISQLQVNALAKLIPRVTLPPLTEHEVDALLPSDLLAIGMEIGSFLIPKADRPDFPPQPTMQ